MSVTFSKTSDEIKSFSIDWSKDLAGDTIASSGNSTWTVSPTGVTIAASSINGSGTLSTVVLSGGMVGQVYDVKNFIITSAGRDLTKVVRVLIVANNYL